LSQHVGGMVMTQSRLPSIVPIENAAMPNRTVVQWDKNDLDALGILKVDCLALGMLTAIRKCFGLVAACGLAGEPLTLATVLAEDPEVYQMMWRADTVGVFQIESRAQMSMLPRLRPKCFYDLVIEVAIVRPGPIQGKMVHPYLRRRCGDEPVEYPDERVKDVLSRTLGVPLFQEQVMQLVVVAAGFTPGEADQLRRAMGAWRRTGSIGVFRQRLLDGMQANGYTTEYAERVYQQICGFGEYGFPESHAASFALLVYVSAWLKRYHPAAFTAALLNSQPMGFYAPAQLVADAKRHGVEVRPVDVNFSDWDCTLEPGVRSQESGVRSQESGVRSQEPGVRGQGPGVEEQTDSFLTPDSCPLTPVLRLGLRQIRGLATRHAERIMMCRKDGPFASFTDFVRRTGLRSGALKRLGQADAFRSLGLGRRVALWKSLPEREPPSLFDQIDVEEPVANLPPMTPFAEVLADYGSAGLTLRQHPVSFLRPLLDELDVVASARLPDMPNGGRLKVGGIVLMRQRPSTANGITFVTLEDETGQVNLIVRREVWERDRRVARGASAMIARGTLQRENEVIHVLVTRLEDLSDKLADLETRSRDFR
jgi:error-prone DNA polymerase